MLRIAGAVLVILFFFDIASASLTYPQFDGLVSYSEGIAVSHLDHEKDTRTYLSFDPSGVFKRQMEFLVSGKPMNEPLLGISSDGKCWFVSYQLNEEYEVTATRFLVFDRTQKLLHERTLEGRWEAEVTPAGILYIASSGISPLQIEELSLETGRTKLYATVLQSRSRRIVDLDAESTIQWAIGPAGKIYVLEGVEDEGVVRVFQKDGSLIRETKVQPDPRTSVAYMKDLHIDAEENVYVIHSSWEVSVSTENSGSIIKLDPQGKEILRIKKNIGYLQEIAVSDTGEVYAYSPGETIDKYKPDGTMELSWDAIPPLYGESWSEKVERIKFAAGVTEKSTLPDLLTGILYGDYEKQRKTEQWITDRGFDAFPYLLKSLEKFPGWQLQNLVSTLIDKFPEDTDLVLRNEFAAGSFAYKTQLLPFVKDWGNPPPGLKSFLLDLSRSEDPRSRAEAVDVLTERGWARDIFAGYLEMLRKGTLTEQQKQQMRWSFSEDFTSALEVLQPVLLDSRDALREDAAAILLSAMTGQIRSSSYKVVPGFPGVAEAAVKAWSKRKDPFVRQNAAVAGLVLGKKGTGPAALKAAGEHPSIFLSSLLYGFGLHPEELGDQAAELVSIVLKSAKPDDVTIQMMDLGEINAPS